MKDVATEFNKLAKKYDSERKELIPVFDDFYGIAVDCIEIEDPMPNVLEIGPGTGQLTEIFLKKYPNAKMDLVDIAENMLEIAKKRFEGNTNLNFYLKDIMEFNPENKQYDAIISSLAIHHLKDSEKKELNNRIAEWIKANGIFVNAEMIAGETKYLNKMYEDWVVQSAKNAKIDEKAREKALNRINLDIKVPISTQLSWLENAGFSHADCIYKAYCLAVLWAKK